MDDLRSAGVVWLNECDICDQPVVERLIQEQQPDVIIHLAARAGVRESLQQPRLYARVNVEGTTVLLEAARLAGVGKFIFASSSSVYGLDNRIPFSEADHLNLPMSPYAATKIAGEKLCYAYARIYGLKTICLRFFSVYGPRQRPDMAIHKFVHLMLEGKAIPIFGDGNTARDYTFVEDIVEGIAAALHYDCDYEIFNLGSSDSVTLQILIETISETIGIQPNLQRVPEYACDIPVTCADISKAQRSLGYRPKIKLAEGIRRFLEWYERAGQ